MPYGKGARKHLYVLRCKGTKKNAKHKIKMKIFLFLLSTVHIVKKCFIRQTGYRIQNTVFKTVGVVDDKKSVFLSK